MPLGRTRPSGVRQEGMMIAVYNGRAIQILILAWLIALVPLGIMWLTGVAITEARLFALVGVIIAVIDLSGRSTTEEVRGLGRFFSSSCGGQIMLLPAWSFGLIFAVLFQLR
jgi:hypothetical protein